MFEYLGWQEVADLIVSGLEKSIGALTRDHLRESLVDDFGTPYSVCRPPRPAFKGNIAAQVQTNTQFENLLRSGDAWIAAWSNDVSAAWINAGEPFQWIMPKEGGESRPLYMAITSGLTPAQRKVAIYIINEFLTPDVAGRHAANTSQISVVDNAIIPASLRNGPYTNPNLLKHTVLPDWAMVGKQDAAWRQLWDSDVASQI